MNTTVVMNNLLNLIHSMSLTASNKQWLADHLYEEVRAERELTATAEPSVGGRRKLQIDPRVAEMFKGVSLPADFDARREYGEYLSEKYQ